MRSPLRVEFFSDLDRNEDSSRTFPRVWCRAFAMGSPVSGRVAYFCALDRNEGLFHPSILSCFAMGSPCGSSVVFLPLDRNEVFFDSWSVFLQDGVILFGSESNDLISSEGITTVGLLGAFFRPVPSGEFLSSFGRPVCSEVGEGSTFNCLRFWQGLCVYPSRQRRSGSWPFFFFWPCCLSPFPGGSVCFGGLAVILFTWAFHALVFHAWWLASGTSGSRTSR